MSIARDQSRPALPKGCPLKRSSINPKGTPDHTGSNPGRIRRQLKNISSPNGGKIGPELKMGKVVTIDAKSTEAIGIANILSIDCSRSKRLSYSRAGRVGNRMALTGIFTRPPLWFRHLGQSLAVLLSPYPDRISSQWHKACWQDRQRGDQAHRHWFCG